MRKMFWGFGRLLGVVLLGVGYGCSTIRENMASDPPQLTPFLPHHELLVRQKAEFPFCYYWEAKNVDWNRYHRIYVAPVNTENVLKDSWWEQVNSSQLLKIKQELPAVSTYMRNSFIRELRKVESRGGLKVVDKPEAGTLTLELALTQLVPTKAELNYLGTAADFFVPGAGMVTNMAAAGNVCFEAKLVDAGNGKVLVMLADRADDPTALIGLTSYTWYGSAQYNIDVWARQAAAMSVSQRLGDVQRDFPLHLITY